MNYFRETVFKIIPTKYNGKKGIIKKQVSFEEVLWPSANNLRGSMQPDDYKTCGAWIDLSEICKWLRNC